MSELQNIEDYSRALEEKIDAWFHRHFAAFEADTEMHRAAVTAHADLKAIIAVIPPVSAPASAQPPASPAS